MMQPCNYRLFCWPNPIQCRDCQVWQSPALLFVLALALCSVSGCGRRSDKLPVSGEVVLNGAPLDGGSIRFTSVEGEKVVSSGAMVQNGQYEVPQQHGLLPGKY